MEKKRKKRLSKAALEAIIKFTLLLIIQEKNWNRLDKISQLPVIKETLNNLLKNHVIKVARRKPLRLALTKQVNSFIKTLFSFGGIFFPVINEMEEIFNRWLQKYLKQIERERRKKNGKEKRDYCKG